MIYQILNKYYIRVAPRKYTEIEFMLKNDDVVIKTTSNKLEANGETVITTFDFQKEKDNIKKRLLNESNMEEGNSTVLNKKYRKRR